MNAQNVREGKSLRVILLLVPLVILAFIALAGPHVVSQTGPNIATGRFLRAADGADLFLHTVSPGGRRRFCCSGTWRGMRTPMTASPTGI